MSPLLWSVRRELWEHRWVWRVPLAVGAILTIVFVGVAGTQLARVGLAEADVQRLVTHHSGMFDLVSRMLLMSGTIVAFVYCAEALHGERRDRAILFWKSWPVGDGTTVAAKAMVALVVVPALTLALLLAARAVAGSVMRTHGLALHAPLANPIAATLEVVAATLWTAPVYAWIMVVSAWARRAVLLLAFLPALLAGIVEAMLRVNGPVGHALFWRSVGRHWPVTLNLNAPLGGMLVATPAPELLRAPALWAGVVVAVLLLAVVVTLRRRI
jgi:ABC-2 type transport system permease protein